jgi:exodeoxyribonuclease VII small subunit
MVQKRKRTAAKPEYESAFTELQGIVSKLEAGTASLEESLELFERGQLLARTCSALLEKAELRIRELTIPDDSAGDEED